MLRSAMRKLAGGQKGPARKPTFTPRCEALERRDLMSASAGLQTVPLTGLGVVKGYASPTAAGLALINGLADTPVRAAALADYQRDGYVSRDDMLDILNKGTAGYTSATPAEFASLEALVSNGSAVAMPSYVQDLASKTLVGGNDELQAEFKGMQEDGVSQVVLQRFLAREPATLAQDIRQEVNDWFLGQVHPDASYVAANGMTVTPTYQMGYLPLFTGAPVYQDVAQGLEGDCCLMASLAEVADRNPGAITSMFIDNGDGTYTVRFYNGSTPDYVTVDTYLPDAGYFYDLPQNNLWAALAEKAYAQENASGWIGSNQPGVDSYEALYGVTPQWALSAITGLAPSSTSYTNAGAVMNAWFQGSFVVLCTGDHPSSSGVVPDHCYAMLNYSAVGFTLFNPWGIHNVRSGSYPGLINLTCPALEANFTSWVQAGAAAGTPAPQAITTAALAQTDAKPAAVAQDPIQPGVHEDSAFAARAGWQVDRALLAWLVSVKHRGGAFRRASSDAPVTDLSGDLDVRF
jgi:hypothetical protein